ncbi:MAG: NAD-dependent deacetylase, partial [Alphaproteobacteria bacterium]|nr:NAD-dependent deacetylase [Alphaproteobacteria bacterium]
MQSAMVDPLAQLLRGRRVLALTGAGCSTESGIPDYRGPETARRARNPIRFQDFVKSPEGRQRYWARSFVGWPRIAEARPNAGHRALAALEQRGLLSGLITQNVDRLHQAAGSRAVIELHGALAEVICLGCGRLSKRADLQARLAALNPGFGRRDAEAAPDGDADLIEVTDFQVAGCGQCGGDLKPHVVFFGENVPR